MLRGHSGHDPPTPTDDLSHVRVTVGAKRSNVPPVAKTWPVAEFQEYLRALMDAAGIVDFAELSRRSGVGQWQFSTWKQGKNQPSVTNLRRIAPVLGVPLVKLQLAAGLAAEDELDLSDQVDLTVLPAELRDFIDLYLGGLTDEQQQYARRALTHLSVGLRAELAKVDNRPQGRRRPA